MSENAYVCPYCQSENIQSYNIAYAGGFSNVNGVTTGVGIGAGGRVGVGIGNTVGTQQTALSMMAKPPMKKINCYIYFKVVDCDSIWSRIIALDFRSK